MRTFAALFLMTAPAMAHPGHIADVAGHDHWVAGVAIGAAVAAALWGWFKGEDEEDPEEAEDDTEEQAA